MIKELIRNPGVVFCRKNENIRLGYKKACNSLLFLRMRNLHRLAAELPKPSDNFRLDPNLGYRVFEPGIFPQTESALALGDDIIRKAGSIAVAKIGKPHLNHLLQRSDLSHYPGLVDFAVHPTFLGVAAEYLNDFPLVTQISIWHSHPTAQQHSNSQLFHRDHDDVRQMKIFLFLSDVDNESGPLTVLPARITRDVSTKINFVRERQANFSDEEIGAHAPLSEAQQLTGPRGTVAFVDTSQMFHYGSRVSRKDRYVLVIQYLTPTNFLMNPFFTFGPYPYAEFARPDHSQVQRLALGAGTVPAFGKEVKALAYAN